MGLQVEHLKIVTNWRRGEVVITTAQLHSVKPELRFCTGSNLACGVSEIRDGDGLWQWSRLEIRLHAFRRPTKPQKQFIIIIIIIKKYIFWINAHPPIEEQSNEGWNTSIQLENNGPSIKVLLIFLFLTMNFNLCFYHQFWVKWVCIHVGNSSGHIGQTHSQIPKGLQMFDTEWNAHWIAILDNLLD